jgi:hypothetical protein
MVQSTLTITHPSLCVNAWLAHMPSVDEARPGCCPRCQSPSRPIGGAIGLHGHGLRTRQLRGPLTPTGPPTTIALDVRRYRCCACGAILTVIPRGMLPRRHFAGSAIAQALARYALANQSRREVRRHTSPWQIVGATAQAGWAALGRWITAIRRGTLFPFVRAMPATFTARQVAERAATTLAALAPSTPGSLLEQAFAGAQAR